MASSPLGKVSLVALVVLAAIVAASCRDGSGGATRPGQAWEGSVAVDASSLHPPGTSLGDGVEVQEGSRLVGQPLPVVEFYPQPGAPSGPLGWQAVLVVDGDPIEVWNSYVAELALDERASAHGACVVQAVRTPTAAELAEDPDAGRPVSRFITEPTLDGENVISCYAVADGVTMALAVGAEPCVSIDPNDRPCTARAASHLYLSVLDDRPDDGFDQLGADQLRYERAQTPANPNEVAEPVAIPVGPAIAPALDLDAASRLPKAGERLDDGLDYFLDGWPAGLMPQGARSLVAPAMLIDCNSGLVALFEVPGSPAEAVRLFRRSAGSGEAGRAVVEGADSQGRAWAGGEISSAGGYDIDLVALESGGGMSTVLFTECGD